MLNHLLDFLVQHEGSSLSIIFSILVACGLGLPIPEDITLVASGIMVSYGVTTMAKSIIVCMIGVLLGDSIIYWIGRTWGKKVLTNRFVAKIARPNLQQSAEKAVHRYGNKVIFFARFLPGLRAPIYFFVGSTRRSYSLFLFIDFLASIISVPVWIYVGEFFGENIEKLELIVKDMKIGSLVIVLFLIFLLIVGGRLKEAFINFINKKLS